MWQYVCNSVAFLNPCSFQSLNGRLCPLQRWTSFNGHSCWSELYFIVIHYILYFFESILCITSSKLFSISYSLFLLLQLTAAYTCKQMTAGWPVARFHNILDASALNGYAVWTAIDPTWNQGKSFKRRLFLAELGKALVTPLVQPCSHIPHTQASATLVRSVRATARATAIAVLPQQDGGRRRKRCELCTPRDLKTSLRCCKCHAYVCKAHSDLSITCHSCA